MDKVPWNRAILDEFISFAMLTDEETEVLRARVAGWSRVKMCHHFNMSLATVDRIIKTLKTKYEYAQSYSELLPEMIDF